MQWSLYCFVEIIYEYFYKTATEKLNSTTLELLLRIVSLSDSHRLVSFKVVQ